MRAAIQFLTIIPVRAPAAPAGSAAPWFPAVGALIGLAAAAALHLPLGAALALGVITLLTGAIHEDGLADVADAVRAHRTRERMIEIMKDPRTGAHGAVALILSFLIRWQALSLITGNLWLLLPAAYGMSRGAMVLAAAWTPAAGSGLGAEFIRTLPSWSAFAVAGVGLPLAALAGFPAGPGLLAANLAAALFSRAYFTARLGGVTGDCLGFTCQLAEALSLVTLACL
jgi:adenosylcobinamide-GDP ribazoletransferase